MTKKRLILIGFTAEGDAVQLDLDKLMVTRLLIQASSGGGKSWLIRLICERIHQFVPFLLIDPEGEFASLRELIDLVLVGDEGEIPADLTAAALLARKLIELRVSAVLDIYELKLPQRREYVRRFSDALIALPKHLRVPTIVINDEVHKFAPERGSSDKGSVSTQSVIDIYSLGRKRGLCGFGATQRFSKLHNDVIADSLNVFIGLTSLADDQALAGKYLGLKGAKQVELRDMQPGEFHCFGPAICVNGSPVGGVIKFKSDKVTTTHPEPGQRRALVAPKASDAIRQIVDHLSDLPQQAAEEAKDIESLTRKVTELKHQLSESEKGAKTSQDAKQLEEMRRSLEQREADLISRAESLDHASAAMNDVAKSVEEKEQLLAERERIFLEQFGVRTALFTERLDVWKGELEELRIHAELPVMDRFEPAMPLARILPPKPVAAPMPAPVAPVSVTPENNIPVKSELKDIEVPVGIVSGPPAEGLSRLQQRIITGLAEIAQFGEANVHRKNLGFFIDSDLTGGPGSQAVKKLSEMGLVVCEPGKVQLTTEGRKFVPEMQPIRSRSELHDRLRNHLDGLQLRIFNALIEKYPNQVHRKVLGPEIRSDLTGGPGSQAAKRLIVAGIITSPVKGELRASDALFPEGLS